MNRVVYFIKYWKYRNFNSQLTFDKGDYVEIINETENGYELYDPKTHTNFTVPKRFLI